MWYSLFISPSLSLSFSLPLFLSPFLSLFFFLSPSPHISLAFLFSLCYLCFFRHLTFCLFTLSFFSLLQSLTYTKCSCMLYYNLISGYCSLSDKFHQNEVIHDNSQGIGICICILSSFMSIDLNLSVIYSRLYLNIFVILSYFNLVIVNYLLKCKLLQFGFCRKESILINHFELNWIEMNWNERRDLIFTIYVKFIILTYSIIVISSSKNGFPFLWDALYIISARL